ncbi:thiolase family protein [Novosphingobium pentaromativorans]|nr:thiolase family protein [Novosphingobium pentaromativorans]
MSGPSGRSSLDMAFDAIDASLADAGLQPSQIDGIMFAEGLAGQVDADAFREHYGVHQDIWMSGDGGAFAQIATAPHAAWQAMQAGLATTIISVLGINWASQAKAGTGGPAQYHREHAIKANAEAVFGFLPQPVYYAHIARRHMIDFGTTAEQLGAIAVACRRHANGHPGAVMRDKPLSLRDYLASTPFIDPVRKEDCCLISDGAAAFIMVASEKAGDFPQPPVTVEGVGYGGAQERTFFAQEPQFTATPQGYAAPGAFAMAGIKPADVDVLTLYDPFTITALMQIEDMGFCAKGEGGAFVEGRALHFDGGGLPFNTHGGMLSHSYTLGASHVVELVRQLRGEAANQVPEARIGVHGGYSGSDAGCMVLRGGLN